VRIDPVFVAALTALGTALNAAGMHEDAAACGLFLGGDAPWMAGSDGCMGA
jgi:hypothetical protein